MDENVPFVVGVDLDGVCADFYAAMRGVVAEWREVEVEALSATTFSYGLKAWGVPDGEYLRIHRFAVVERALFRTMPMVAGARRALRSLSNDGFHIRIITHRLFVPYFHRQAVEQTVAWLDHHAIPYSDLCFMKDKGLVDADVYVEDTPHNIRALENDRRTAIAFTNPTNIDMDPAPKRRANDWEEAEAMIRALRGDTSEFAQR